MNFNFHLIQSTEDDEKVASTALGEVSCILVIKINNFNCTQVHNARANGPVFDHNSFVSK